MFIECRNQLEKLIKEEYKSRLGSEYPSEKVLPQYIDFYREDNRIKMTIKKACENMQDNCNAFDSWAIAVKNWVREIDSVIISWEKPENINNLHYQRYLYRVEKAAQIFDFIEIQSSNMILLNDSVIKDGEVYVVNVPLSESGEEAARVEASYERMFIKECGGILAKQAGMDNNNFYNQLPVGLFRGKIAYENRIFPSTNAAIDLWGLNKTKKELVIFELKKPGTNPIGIFSELFFYSMFVRDVLEKRFIYKNIDNIKNYRGIKHLIESEYKYIKAYFLATKLHPLIDEDMLRLINRCLKACNIKFGYIEYSIECKNGFTWKKRQVKL